MTWIWYVLLLLCCISTHAHHLHHCSLSTFSSPAPSFLYLTCQYCCSLCSLDLKYILLEYFVDSDCINSGYLISSLHLSVCRWLFYVSMLHVYWKRLKGFVWEVFIPHCWVNTLVLFYACSVCNSVPYFLCIGLFIALLYVFKYCIGKLTLFVHIVCTIMWRR